MSDTPDDRYPVVMKPYDPPSEETSKKHHDGNVYQEKISAIKEDFQHIPEPEQQGGIYRLMKVWVSNLVFATPFDSQDPVDCRDSSSTELS
jgi:hypothetical protein